MQLQPCGRAPRLTDMARRFSHSETGAGKGPSQRQLRAGELLRHTLAEIFQREDFRDPDLRDVSITISEVRPSPDLRSATVFCLPLGGQAQESVVKALNRVAGEVQFSLGRKIELKFTPQLRFRLDNSFDEASHIDALLAEAHRKDRG